MSNLTRDYLTSDYMRSPDWNTVQPLNLRDELVLQDDNSVRLNTGDEILELRFLEIEGNVALRLSCSSSTS